MRIENSPEFDAEMAERHARWQRERVESRAALDAAKEKWRAGGRGWLPMEECPFSALDDQHGMEGTIVVTDGKERALASVAARVGRPVFYKTGPEYVMRDGRFYIEGGEEDPRADIPKWWWDWEMTDLNGAMTYAHGDETGREEVSFMPTKWTFLPEIDCLTPERV